MTCKISLAAFLALALGGCATTPPDHENRFNDQVFAFDADGLLCREPKPLRVRNRCRTFENPDGLQRRLEVLMDQARLRMRASCCFSLFTIRLSLSSVRVVLNDHYPKKALHHKTS